MDHQRKTNEPLIEGYSGHNLEKIKHAIESGANVNLSIPHDGYHTPLCLAVMNRSFTIIDYLLRVPGLNVNAVASGCGKTALYYCFDEEIVALLLKNGADVDFKDHKGTTPLHYFAQNGRLGMARCLLDNGANLEATDIDGATPLHYAIDFGRV